MPATEKILWVVGYNSLDAFHDLAMNAGVTGVAIRTDNNLVKAIPKFHNSGLKVFGWRWPSANRDPAMTQAAKAASLLKDEGMDGYFVDPEGEKGKHWDWDQPGLENLAGDFCAEVKEAAPGKRFGVTSHFKAHKVFPNLPWQPFLEAADVLLPQSYWRVAGGNVFKGNPAQNYRLGIKHWTDAGGNPARIVPMAGEIALTTAAKISEYAAEAAIQGRTELHFYTSTPVVTPSVWQAIAAA